MPEALRFYCVLQLAAAAVLPLALAAARGLPDRGWSLAKPLGVFALALADRWLSASGLLGVSPPARTRFLLAAALAVAAGFLFARRTRRRLAALWARERATILAVEGAFALVFVGALGLRSLDAGPLHTEQPMDLMLLAAELDAPRWPVEDPWLAGEPLGYYTLGHAAAAVLARVAAVPLGVAYNVAFAAWWALAAVALAGAGGALLRPFARRSSGRILAALGGMAALLVANPVAVGDALRRLADPDFGGGVWWWRSSRLLVDEYARGITETISEFPLFGFVVGDLHAHFLALPLAAAAAGLALALERTRCLGAVHGVAAALLTGAAVSTNSWDVPWIAPLLAGGAALGGQGARARLARAGGIGGAALAGGALVALPHLLVASRPVTALVVNVATASSPGELATLFAAVLPGLALLLSIALAGHPRPRRGLLAAALAAAALAAVLPALLALVANPARGGALELPEAASLRAPLATLAARGAGGAVAVAVPAAVAVLAAGLAFGRGPRALRGALLLAATGAALVATPEIVFLRDLFGTRLNMVFKLHHAAWPPLALAALAGCVVALARTGARTGALAGAPSVATRAVRLRRAAAATALAVLVSGVAFAAAVAVERFARRSERALDLLAALDATAPDEAAAVRWVRDFVPRDATVLEAPGESYHEEQNRISRSTGRATLLGWGGHEAMWRGPGFGETARQRLADAHQIYAGVSAGAKSAALVRRGIDWIYVGPAERARYAPSAAAERALAAVAEPVFRRGAVTIWRRRGA